MRAIVAIGQSWQRRSDGRVYRVGQIWRADNSLLLTPDDGYRGQVVTFAQIGREYYLADER